MHDLLKKIAKKYGFLLIKEEIYKKEKEDLYIKSKAAGIRAGKEIGILQVLRYNQQTLSAAKFKESARFFDFDGLNEKYPFSPLFEKPHEKMQPTPRSLQGIIEKDEPPQVHGNAG